MRLVIFHTIFGYKPGSQIIYHVIILKNLNKYLNKYIKYCIFIFYCIRTIYDMLEKVYCNQN